MDHFEFEGAFGHFDLEIRDVRGRFQVHGTFSAPRRQNETIDLGNRILLSEG
jgi:hypothetical protein